MATPTPVTWTRQVGHGVVASWKATWSTTDNFTDTVLVDLSTLASGYVNNLKVKRLTIGVTANIDVLIEFDASTDQLVVFHAGGNQVFVYDFTGLPDGGLVKDAAGATGDLVMTTANAASGEEVFVLAECWAD